MVTLRAQQLKNGTYSLYLDIYQAGKRQREYLDIHVGKDYTKPMEDKAGNLMLDASGKPREKRVDAKDKEKWDLASSIRMKRELEIKVSDHGFVASFKKQADFIAYFEKVAGQNRHPSYTATLGHLKAFAGNFLAFKAVSLTWIENFTTYLLGKMIASTACLYLTKLKAVLKQAIKDRIITHNPFDSFEMPDTDEAQRVYLEFNELQALYACDTGIAPIVRAAFLFACYSGLRISDIKKLEWSAIKGSQLDFRQQKSSKNFQHLPLPATALKLLVGIERVSEKIFDGLPTQSTINTQLTKWAKHAGIKKHLSFHVSRHTFATMALTNGVDLYTVSKLLGHSDISVTQIYAKVIDLKKREAMDKLPEL